MMDVGRFFVEFELVRTEPRCAAQVFYVDLISLECTTSDDIEETQLIDLKNEDNRTAEVTIIDDDEPGVIACARGVPSCGVTPSTRVHLTMTWVVF